MARYTSSCITLAALALLAIPAAAPAAWIVTEVPMLPHWAGGVEVADINSSGVVCGMGNYVINTTSTVFRFDGQTVTELPHLVPTEPISLCTGINAAGVICGYSRNAAADSQAVYWQGAAISPLPYPPDANTDSDFRAYGLNDAGVIVGYFWNTAGVQTAFYYKDGTSYSLAAALAAAGLPGAAFAYDVNNANVICGIADNAAGISSSWTYAIDTAALTVIGRIGTEDCSAVAINLAGQTIGRAKQTSADIIRAVTFDGAWHVVDSAISSTQWGEAINDAGRMIGNTGASASRTSWYSDGPGAGSAVTLVLPGWTRVTAQGINNRAQIAGYGRTATSGTDTRGFIVSPPPGDFDHDGDVDLADYEAFANCLSGPQEGAAFVAPPAACLGAFDFAPADGDVDLVDFAAFQQTLPD